MCFWSQNYLKKLFQFFKTKIYYLFIYFTCNIYCFHLFFHLSTLHSIKMRFLRHLITETNKLNWFWDLSKNSVIVQSIILPRKSRKHCKNTDQWKRKSYKSENTLELCLTMCKNKRFSFPPGNFHGFFQNFFLNFSE